LNGPKRKLTLSPFCPARRESEKDAKNNTRMTHCIFPNSHTQHTCVCCYIYNTPSGCHSTKCKRPQVFPTVHRYNTPTSSYFSLSPVLYISSDMS
jgi:hypothetical protein